MRQEVRIQRPSPPSPTRDQRARGCKPGTRQHRAPPPGTETNHEADPTPETGDKVEVKVVVVVVVVIW